MLTLTRIMRIEPSKVRIASERRPITAAALKLARWYFVRPGELRGARLAELDPPPSLSTHRDRQAMTDHYDSA